MPAKPPAKLDVAVAKKIGPVPNADSEKPHLTNARPAPPQAKPHTETVRLTGVATSNRPERGSNIRKLPIPPEPAGPPKQIARNEIQSELRHARFLIKAGLSPVAADSLRKIIKEAPGTSAAREAQQSLDSIPKAK
jgi:hypothetical protein